ncbi:alpha/beta fold hydrolase [Microbacterium sp.]|uniref:alpha/beta fold hydrolase n=1 Tax=Microbacterium sp. TaxID=51671 RepID=UPI000926A87E|nr:alpha/beta fold hydrolase [Microbacterium sp.]MBN9187585.1 alpha/beta fold hydrolase [Microbacterium sp.]MBN9192528.1 alpha/beta fold hydrolase [Microbacterium sp.]OJU59339.1 MAG: hypothetical protein BGO04_15305 [Microbacterium sp. 70-38]
MTARTIVTARGGRLGITGLGDPASHRLVVVFHPAPGASRFDPDPAFTRHWGVHLLGIERPGYGASEAVPTGGRASFEEFADDVAEYLRQIRQSAQELPTIPFRSVGVLGWGVGAVAASVFAARHPHRLDALVLVDAPAHPSLDDLHAPFRAADLGIRDEARVDAAHPGILARVHRMLDDAAGQGDSGIEFDRAACASSAWLDDLDDITVPAVLVYGDDHPFVDRATDGSLIAARIPDARIAHVPETSGLAVAAVWSRILEHLAPRHGSIPGGKR